LTIRTILLLFWNVSVQAFFVTLALTFGPGSELSYFPRLAKIPDVIGLFVGVSPPTDFPILLMYFFHRKKRFVDLIFPFLSETDVSRESWKTVVPLLDSAIHVWSTIPPLFPSGKLVIIHPFPFLFTAQSSCNIAPSSLSHSDDVPFCRLYFVTSPPPSFCREWKQLGTPQPSFQKLPPRHLSVLLQIPLLSLVLLRAGKIRLACFVKLFLPLLSPFC